MQKVRGMSLVTILMGMSVLLLLLFVMAEAATFHLQFASGLDARQEAKNLAESAVNEALAAALGDDSYGKNAVAVVIPGPGDPTRNYGVVSFGNADVRAPQSLNHLDDPALATGSTGQNVPGHTFHLVGVGRCGDSTSTVETVFYRPPFPKALSASGRIKAVGTVVTGMQQGTNYPSDPTGIPPSSRMPGCIQTNASDQGQNKAIDLLQCSVSGDAAAVGSVQLDSSTTVAGQVRQGGTAQPLPHVDVLTRINNIKNSPGTEILTGPIGNKTINWFSGCNDPSLTINGDLELHNGVLWTVGDLVITGGVKGQGLILCGGNLEIRKGTSLAADNLIAAACVGDVTLKGQDANRNNYYFQGVIYTNGNFKSQDLTVIGSVIAESTDPNKGGLELNNVNVVQTPECVSICQGNMVRVWQTRSKGRHDRPGEKALGAPATNPPGPIRYASPAERGPGIPDPSAVPSMVYFCVSPTAEEMLQPVDRRGQRLYNFAFKNAQTNAPLLTGLNVPGQKGTQPGNNFVDHIMWMTGTNFVKPPLNVEDTHVNDALQQLNQELSLTRSELISRMLFPPVNSLMTPGESSRVLLWKCY